MEMEEKMVELIEKLKQRNNAAYKFFEGLITELKDEQLSGEAKKKLLSCYAITQYADFTPDEERLLTEIIESNCD